jgi:hypothetical protein
LARAESKAPAFRHAGSGGKTAACMLAQTKKSKITVFQPKLRIKITPSTKKSQKKSVFACKTDFFYRPFAATYYRLFFSINHLYVMYLPEWIS